MENKFLDSHNHLYYENRWLSFSDIELVPQFTQITNTADINTSSYFKNQGYRYPYYKICNDHNEYLENVKKGYMSFLSPYGYSGQSNFIDSLVKIKKDTKTCNFIIGLNKNDANVIDHISNLIEKDSINPTVFISSDDFGDSDEMISQIRHLRLKYKQNIDIIAGYISAPFTVMKAIDLGVDGIVFSNDHTKCDLTGQLKIFNSIYSKQANTKLFVSYLDQYKDIDILAAGADFISQESVYDSNIERLKADMKKYNCKTVGEIYNKTKFRVIK
jgi:hypothetical protein